MWTYVFKNTKNIGSNFTNFKIIVELLSCIPGSNSNVERILSRMNNLWNKKKKIRSVYDKRYANRQDILYRNLYRISWFSTLKSIKSIVIER